MATGKIDEANVTLSAPLGVVGAAVVLGSMVVSSSFFFWPWTEPTMSQAAIRQKIAHWQTTDTVFLLQLNIFPFGIGLKTSENDKKTLF